MPVEHFKSKEAYRSIDLAWLAGIIEGEGNITIRGNSPIIRVGMTDKDVINRVAVLFRKFATVRRCRPSARPYYCATVCGTHAASLLMTVFCLLGERRQAKAKEVLDIWRNSPRIDSRGRRINQRNRIGFRNPIAIYAD